MIELDSSFQQEIEKLEKERKKQIEFAKKVGYIAYPVAGCLGLFMWWKSFGGFLFVALGALISIPTLVKLWSQNHLTHSFKNNLIAPLLNKLRPGVVYLPSASIQEQIFNESNLFSKPDRYKGEDLFQGKHDKTLFSFSEIHAEKEHKSKNSTTYSTIFKGVFMVADFNKHIKNETYVFTSGGKWFSKFKRVKLENPEFEDNFNVYSDNQIEARYILTPSLMEKIIKLEKEFNAQLFMSFIGRNVYIALKNNENFFEPDFSKEVSSSLVNDIVREIDSCIEIIDELDLNTRIWTKD